MPLSEHEDVPQGVTARHAGLLEPDKQATWGVAEDPNEFNQPSPYAEENATVEGFPGNIADGTTVKPTRRNHIGSTTPTLR